MRKRYLFKTTLTAIIASAFCLTTTAQTAVAQGVATAAVGSEPVESELAAANRAIANPLTNNVLFITESDTFRTRGDITDKKR